MKQTFCCIIVITLLAALIPPYNTRAEDGRIVAGFLVPIGTPDPQAIEIHTAEDLRKMTDSNGSFVLMNDIDLSGYETWEPISNFGGIFDGQGYVIRNMSSIASKNTNKLHAGLFMDLGYTTGKATIKNLSMKNAAIDLSYLYSSSGTPTHYGGVIASRTSGTVIDNCIVECVSPEMIIQNDYAWGNNNEANTIVYVGGIAGDLTGGTITNCVAVTNLNVNNANLNNCYTHLYLGGLVGGNVTSIENCQVSGVVTGFASAKYPVYSGNMVYPTAYSCVGGLVGRTTAKISVTNCVNNAIVYSESETSGNSGVNKRSAAYAGGIIGYPTGNGSVFTDCVNKNQVIAISESLEIYGYADSSAGGIAGYTVASFSPDSYSTFFDNCVSDSRLISAEAQGYSNSWAAAGSIISSITGYNINEMALNLTNCTGTGEIHTLSDSNVQSYTYCGGLVGLVCATGNARANLTVENSRHTGSINPEPNTSANESHNWLFAGGVAGQVLGGSGEIEFKPYCFYSEKSLSPVGSITNNVNGAYYDKISVIGEENINPDVYTVTFNTNGGSSITGVEIINGETIDTPPDPTRAGFTFDGWYLEPELRNIVSFPYKVEKNIILYAKWESNEKLVYEINVKNLSAQGINATKLSVYKTEAVFDDEQQIVTEASYKLVLEFSGLAQYVRLYVAMYDTNGNLKGLLLESSGSTVINKLEMKNIPLNTFDENFRIYLWDEDMRPIIEPITSFK